MIFNKESDFEEALIKILCKYGWENKVLGLTDTLVTC